MIKEGQEYLVVVVTLRIEFVVVKYPSLFGRICIPTMVNIYLEPQKGLL